MNIQTEIEKRKLHLLKGGFQCGIGTALTDHRYTNETQQHCFIISWMLKCEGTFTEGETVYPLHDACV